MLLGSVGAHWFYLGKPGLGVLCILTVWTGIPTIAGFIFGIRSLVADDETFKTKIMW
jgi:TM2 domain-containing membrane protein YozV